MLPSPSHRASFTLIELLIVIAILATLAAVIIVVINPAELLRQGRDAQRLSDLSNLNRSLSWLKADCPACSLGLPNTVYVSIPDTSPTCANLGLPSLPSGWSYACVTQANLFKADGSGWIPVDFSKFSAGSPLAKLPVDPVNTTSSGNYYTYVTGGSWELTAQFESQKYSETKAKDGGPDPAMYEVGTNLNLSPFVRGLVGYWPFEEGSGTTAKDQSGNNNTGTLINGPTWTQGKVGSALSFDGVDDRVDLGNVLNFGTGAFTISAWVKPTNCTKIANTIVSKGNANFANGWYFRVLASTCNLGFSAANSTQVSVDNVIANNQLFYVSLTRTSGAVLTLYVNGTVRASGSYAGDLTNTLSFIIGDASWYLAQGYGFEGTIDEVRLYNRALSDAEIKALYDATK
jgi:prepilin-type N-terminal cleavage/methylation domain-containing protein